ncbi:MAG: helix-turn-helix domain-containing protein [Solirubrobacteraceae bacterium]|nr:helix-turn-helix domain-containing protein [Solirubrobacteraceae bacterium]
MSQEQPPVPGDEQPGAATSPAFPIYPWSVLPPRLATRLEPAVPALAELLVTEISTNVPQYTGRRSERFWTGIRQGVEQSLHVFLQLIGEPRGPDPQLRAIVRGLGRNEHEAGRTLDALQMAYRIGARHSWRTFATLIATEQLTTEQVTAFAESTFAFVDELAAESVAGYTESQAAAASEQERLRSLLLTALTGPAPDTAMVRRTASAVGWLLPERVRAISTSGGELRALARSFGGDALTAAGEGDELVVLWPDPDGPGRSSRLELALSRVESPAALGPAVPLASAARSLRGARETLALGVRGGIGPGPWRWDDHLAAIGLAQAAEPLSELADRLIAPLRAESDGSRMRLLQTLEAVLDAGGNHGTAAHELGIHVQTVRYRLGRLRELLGPLLDDPKRRFELHVALRARRVAMGPVAETFRDRRR